MLLIHLAKSSFNFCAITDKGQLLELQDTEHLKIDTFYTPVWRGVFMDLVT